MLSRKSPLFPLFSSLSFVWVVSLFCAGGNKRSKWVETVENSCSGINSTGWISLGDHFDNPVIGEWIKSFKVIEEQISRQKVKALFSKASGLETVVSSNDGLMW